MVYLPVVQMYFVKSFVSALAGLDSHPSFEEPVTGRQLGIVEVIRSWFKLTAFPYDEVVQRRIVDVFNLQCLVEVHELELDKLTFLFGATILKFIGIMEFCTPFT